MIPCDSLSPCSLTHSGVFVWEGLLAEQHRAKVSREDGETIPKSSSCPNSHFKSLLCSLKLVTALEPFLLISLQEVSSCPWATPTHSTPHHQGCWGLLGQECCWNSQHLPASLKRPHGKRGSLIQMTHYLQHCSIIVLESNFCPFQSDAAVVKWKFSNGVRET